jgi:iron-sulfur cluster assembly protein
LQWKKSFLYLAGTILEFSGGINGKGFIFNNPNANRTCGCGESFSLKTKILNPQFNFFR